MRNYSDRVYRLPYSEVIDIYENDVKEDIEKEVFNKRWQLYTSVYPYMLKGELKGMGYEEFSNMLDGKSNSDSKTNSNSIQYNDMSEEDALKFLNELEKRPVKMVKKTGQNISN